MGSEFAPAGSILITVLSLLLGAMVLVFAVIARRGGPRRNFATADSQDLRSVIWTSEETWRASHRANAPWLHAAAASLFVGGLVMIGAMIVQGASEAASTVLTILCVVLLGTIACCIAAGIAGRTAARRVLAHGR